MQPPCHCRARDQAGCPCSEAKGRTRAHHCSSIRTAAEGQAQHDAQRCTGMHSGSSSAQPSRKPFSSGGRLLSSQEGMWPQELQEMYFPFCGHQSQELTAAQAMRPSRQAWILTARPQQDLPHPRLPAQLHHRQPQPQQGQVSSWHKLLEPGGGRRLTDLVLLSLHQISSLAGPAA